MTIDDTPVTFAPFDAADFLRDDADIAAYLEAAIAEDDPVLLARALGAVARARNMTDLARDTGLSRQSLYKALSPSGNPSLDTIMRVVRALGWQITLTKRQKPRATATPRAHKSAPRLGARGTGPTEKGGR